MENGKLSIAFTVFNLQCPISTWKLWRKPKNRTKLSEAKREETHSQTCASVHLCDSGICVIRQGTWNNSDQYVQESIENMNKR